MDLLDAPPCRLELVKDLFHPVEPRVSLREPSLESFSVIQGSAMTGLPFQREAPGRGGQAPRPRARRTIRQRGAMLAHR